MLLGVLAASPIAVLGTVALFGFKYDTPLGSLIGDAAIIVPLAIFVFSRGVGFSARVRHALRFALGSFLLLIPALLMHFSPAASRSSTSSRIYLDPPPHQMPAQAAAVLRGLSVEYGVMILKRTTGESEEYTAIVGNQDKAPPFHFHDEHANGIDFRMPGPDLLHFQDDRGGYADVRWDGRRFVLAASASAGQAANVRSIANRGVRTLGDSLLIVTPMLAWLLITLAALLRSNETDRPSASLILAGLLQIAGLALLIFLLAAAPARMDEVSGGIMAMGMLCVLCCSGAGLAILGFGLLRMNVALEQKNADEGFEN